MITLHEKHSIEMWLRQEFPGEDISFIRKRTGGFVVRYKNKRLDKRKIKRVVNEFYRCAKGTTVKWGKATVVP